MNVQCAELESPIGTIELAVRDGALCALRFVDARRTLEEVVSRRFGIVNLQTLSPTHAVIEHLRAYFAGDVGVIDAISVDTSGTPFQSRVWAQLRQIRAGERSSYRDVAAAIGAPMAVRAVGTANGANPIGIVVPCHRVVRSGGGLGGYGGGLERKRWLLEHELRFTRNTAVVLQGKVASA